MNPALTRPGILIRFGVHPFLEQKEKIVRARFLPLLLIVLTAGLLRAGDPAKSKIVWTNDVTKMTVPAAPVTGKVAGKEFKPTFISYNSFLRQLIFAQSSGGVHPEIEVRVSLFIEPKDKIDGRTFVLDPKKGKRDKAQPDIALSPDGKKLPERVEMPATEVAMKLEFGREKDGVAPGKIYLCMSDKKKSVLAGTFEAKTGK
jgi:hypothetical protein